MEATFSDFMAGRGGQKYQVLPLASEHEKMKKQDKTDQAS